MIDFDSDIVWRLSPVKAIGLTILAVVIICLALLSVSELGHNRGVLLQKKAQLEVQKKALLEAQKPYEVNVTGGGVMLIVPAGFYAVQIEGEYKKNYIRPTDEEG